MTNTISRRGFGLGLGLGLAVPTLALADGKVTIKLGTLAPEGTDWHTTLQSIGQQWMAASKNQVELKIYPGGVAGDEGDMVRKMRISQLHAATITNIGLGSIHKATMALQVPMMMQSWDELDYVRSKLGAELEKELEDAGYIVLNWGDAGWVHFFGTKPVTSPDDLRALKLFVWSGDPDSENAWRTSKFNVVPLASTEVMPALQTGMIQAFQTTPVFALSSQWFTLAKQMAQVNWSPLNGATVVLKKQWEKIDPALRPELLRIARAEGEALKLKIRAKSDEALVTMAKRGLVITKPDAAQLEAWRKVAELAYPIIRGKVVPEKYFDAVQALVKDYRANPSKK